MLRKGKASELAVGSADRIVTVYAATLVIRAEGRIGRVQTLEARARELKGAHIIRGGRGRSRANSRGPVNARAVEAFEKAVGAAAGGWG